MSSFGDRFWSSFLVEQISHHQLTFFSNGNITSLWFLQFQKTWTAKDIEPGFIAAKNFLETQYRKWRDETRSLKYDTARTVLDQKI